MNDLLVTCKKEIEAEIENIDEEDYEVGQYFSEDENSYRLSRIPDEIEVIPIMNDGECTGNNSFSYQKYRSPQISFNSSYCESCECYRKELKSLKQQLKDAEEKNKFLSSKLKTDTNPIKPSKPQLKYIKNVISKQQKSELPTPSPTIVKPAGRVKRNLLSVQNHAKLNGISAGEKNDYIYVSCMLTMLWTKSELMCRSVTGKPSRNIMYGRVAKRPMTPMKVQLIKDKVMERVQSEDLSQFDIFKRTNDKRVHRFINVKLQNLKKQMNERK